VAGVSAAAWPYLAALTILAAIGTGIGGAYLLKKAEPVSAAPSAAVTIESDPAGAEVTADGLAKGVTPLTLSVVHHVQFDLATPSVATPGTSPPSKVPPTSPAAASGVNVPAGPAAGWLAITSPIPLTVTEGGQVIGSTASAKIMVPAGRRELRFANESLGFVETRTVQVSAGKTATVAVSIPKAPISINAVPWAEVWVDGVRAGETPIGNYMVTLGSRDIVFRHPTLGERRQTANVSLTAPARISVDMRKQ
jgi:hypothetical protein